jgi:hypothetical protein
MRTAKEISLAEDFSTRHIQAHSLHDDVDKNQKNVGKALDFIKQLTTQYGHSFCDDTKHKGLVWKKIPADLVLKFIKSMSFPQTEFDMLASGQSGLLTAYIEDRISSELREWDVGVPYITSGSSHPVQLPVQATGGRFCRSRSGTVRVSPSVIKVNKKNAVAFGTEELMLGEDADDYKRRVERCIEEAKALSSPGSGSKVKVPSETWAYSNTRSRPLLLLHFLQLVPDEQVQMKLPKDKPVASIGILLPGTSIRCTERKYQATIRLIEMLKRLREESETDEVIEDE